MAEKKPEAPPLPKLAYTVKEACEVVGIGRSRMYDLLREGRIRAKREGDRRLILRAELDRYLVSLPDAA